MSMTRVAFYIDSHGFGHSTRSIALISRFPPNWEVHLKTNAPTWLFHEELQRPFRIEPSPFDLHPIQSRGYQIDLERTRQFLAQQMAESERWIESEVTWQKENGIDLVFSDISPLAIEAAHRHGISGYGVSSFTWHWILETMLDDSESIENLQRLREMTRHATQNFRLPLSVPQVFPEGAVETPLLIRSPRLPRNEFRSRCGMDPEKTYVLVTFGGFDDPNRDLAPLQDLAPVQFIRTLPHSRRRVESPERFLRRDETLENLLHYVNPNLYHPDLVGAVDAVITKPGYGILSETLPLGTPLLLDTREDFREFLVIRDDLADYPQVCFLPSSRMESFDFGEELGRVLDVRPEPWRGRTDGAEFIVESVQ